MDVSKENELMASGGGLARGWRLFEEARARARAERQEELALAAAAEEEPASPLPTDSEAVEAIVRRPVDARPPAPARRVRLEEVVERSVSSALDVGVPERALPLYRLLLETSVRVASARGYGRGVTQVSFFAPAEVVAAAWGVGRATLYRHLGVLKAAGLVAQRGHFTSLGGVTRADGSVWTVRLVPGRGRARLRVPLEDLREQYRDLRADIDRGRTAYRQVATLRQSTPSRTSGEAVTTLLGWALPPGGELSPLVTVSPVGGVGLERVLDLPLAPRETRATSVDAGARAILEALGDAGSNLNAWRKLMWQALRLHDRGEDVFEALYAVLVRAQVDRREGFARRAGALAISRLQKSDLWERLRAAPPYRVGVRPAAAAA